MLDNDLEITPVLVKRYLAADANLLAFLRNFFHPLVEAPEHGAADLAFAIFQGKIPMARRGAGESGQFTLNPNLHEAGFQQVAGLVIELADTQRSGPGILETAVQRGCSFVSVGLLYTQKPKIGE